MNKQLPYDRVNRVADAIRQLVSVKLLSDISDPRLSGVQIIVVRMTRDLRIARVYYNIFNATDERKREVERGFKSASRFIRRMIAEEIQLKFAPELEFYYDESIEIRDRIDELLEGGEKGGLDG
jgi:ribosome-binding factor A